VKLVAEMSAPSGSHDPPPLPSASRLNLLWRALRPPVRFLFALLFRFRAFGENNIPSSGGALFLVNHQSYLDPVILALPMKRPLSMVARKNLYEIPLFGRILKALYGLAIDRDSPGTGIIREMLRRLEHGFLIGIFPEGTRSSGLPVAPVKPGFLSILRRTDVPVIPVGIAGADRALPKGAKFIRPARICITFGEPIPGDVLAPLKVRGREEDLLQLVRERIQTEVYQSAERLGLALEQPAPTANVGETPSSAE
jgi:1-acyl-sn-glycerol-3-phosphate acyltransferase